MLTAYRISEVFNHAIVYRIGTALYRPAETASSGNTAEV